MPEHEDAGRSQAQDVVIGPGGKLTWAILRRFTDYVLAMEGGQVWIEGGVTEVERGLFAYPLTKVHREERRLSYAFRGTVRFVGHSGLLDLPFSDPILTFEGSTCILTIVDPDGGPRLVLAQGRTVTEPSDAPIEVSLAPDGSEYFFSRYPVGMALEPLEVQVSAVPNP